MTPNVVSGANDYIIRNKIVVLRFDLAFQHKIDSTPQRA
jgi:hypothetical protein